MGNKKFKYVVYMITFPNGKIYVGKDVGSDGHTIRYFGSWDYKTVESEFSKSELSDFSIRRTILFESADKGEVSRKEVEFIKDLGANNPKFGYNKSPKFRE